MCSTARVLANPALANYLNDLKNRGHTLRLQKQNKLLTIHYLSIIIVKTERGLTIMFGNGFLQDLFKFFENLLKSSVSAKFLSMLIFGIIVILIIGFLITFTFILPKEIHKISVELEKLNQHRDDD